MEKPGFNILIYFIKCSTCYPGYLISPFPVKTYNFWKMYFFLEWQQNTDLTSAVYQLKYNKVTRFNP